MANSKVERLLRSVYRLLDATRTPDKATSKAWQALRDEIEAYLVDSWEPVDFSTFKNNTNEIDTIRCQNSREQN